jgi:hypothetical protein
MAGSDDLTIQLFVIHFAGYAPSLAVKDPAKGLSRILTLGTKRQIVLGDEVVSSVLHTLFDEFIFIPPRPLRFHGKTLVQLDCAVGAVFLAVTETLTLLIVILGTTSTQTCQSNEQDSDPTSHCTTPFGQNT